MKQLFTVLAALSVITPAVAQQPQPVQQGPAVDYHLTVTTQELVTIGDALSAKPFKEVSPLIQKLNGQIAQQEVARNTPKPEDKPAEAPKQ